MIDIDFKNIDFSNEKMIELLIITKDINTEILDIPTLNGLNSVNQSLKDDIFDTYSYLDELIDSCKFNEEQVKLISYLAKGYRPKHLTDIFKCDSRTIKRKIVKICNSIKSENDTLIELFEYKKNNKQTKVCSKCNKELPLSVDYFYSDKKGKDGYRNKCKKCSK